MPLPHETYNVVIPVTRINDWIDGINSATATLASGLKVATYTATLAQVLNTTTETDVLHFTIPAASMADGDLIEARFTALAKNNKGSLGTATFKVNVGAGSQVTTATTQASNSGTEYQLLLGFTLQRMGSTVLVVDLEGTQLSNPWSASAAAGSSSPANFTSDQVVTLKVTLDAADASFYLKPQSAVVTHRKN